MIEDNQLYYDTRKDIETLSPHNVLCYMKSRQELYKFIDIFKECIGLYREHWYSNYRPYRSLDIANGRCVIVPFYVRPNKIMAVMSRCYEEGLKIEFNMA